MTVVRFRKLEMALRAGGYGALRPWPQSIKSAKGAQDFAARVIHVTRNSGMRVTIAAPIPEKCFAALREGCSVGERFGHPRKAVAIDLIWRDREALFERYRGSNARLDFLETLPWIGPVTKHHLAKNLGA